MAAFESDRRFEVRRWGVGHRGLLLRTMHVDGEPRIEIWVKPADAVSLPSWLDGLSIAEAGPDEVKAWTQAHPGVPIGRDSALFIIQSGSFRGWVVGGSLNTREDSEDYFAPSPWDMQRFE